MQEIQQLHHCQRFYVKHPAHHSDLIYEVCVENDGNNVLGRLDPQGGARDGSSCFGCAFNVKMTLQQLNAPYWTFVEEVAGRVATESDAKITSLNYTFKNVPRGKPIRIMVTFPSGERFYSPSISR